MLGSVSAELVDRAHSPVLVVRGDLAGTTLSEALRARGAVVDDVVAYRTTEAPAGSRGLLRSAVEAGPIAGVILTSGSTARGLRRLADAVSVDVAGLPAVCIGDATAVAAREAGFRVVAVAPAVVVISKPIKICPALTSLDIAWVEPAPNVR